MLLNIFTDLTHALSSSAYLALFASFIWGVLSVLLSPCHLSTIPLIVGFINGQQVSSTKRAFILALLFSLGIMLSIAGVGIVTGLSGRLLGDVGPMANYAVAIVLVGVGIYLLDLVKLPSCVQWGQPNYKKKGLFAAFILGLIYGIALGPCTFAYMIPVLGIAFSKAAESLLFSILLVGVYAVGHCGVIVFVGTSSEWVQRYLNWNAQSKGTIVVKRICAVLIILGGIYVVVK